MCEEQLSKQRHYDFGLRNILSVLRSCGQLLRDNLPDELKNTDAEAKEKRGKLEENLLYKVLRDMNLSKFVADDVELFKALLRDVFSCAEPKSVVYGQLEKELHRLIKEASL